MFIQKYLSSLVYPYKPQGERLDHNAVPTPALSIEFPRVTLFKAVLDKQADNALRWMVLDRFGYPEYRIFKNEAALDAYLSQNESIDIWEIEDKRSGQTLYKCCDLDDCSTFSTREALYREIASTTDHGVFELYDLTTQEKIYIQQKKNWFQYGFEEITLEQAQKSWITRETNQTKWRTITTVGIAALVTTTVIVGIEKILSKNVQDFTNRDTNLFSSSVFYALPKTTVLFHAVILSYGALEQRNLPLTMMMGALASFKNVEAKRFCPTLDGIKRTSQDNNIKNVQGIAVFDIDGNSEFVLVADVEKGLLIYIKEENEDGLDGYSLRGLYNTKGLLDITLFSQYAYGIGDSSNIQIFDMSNKADPTLVSTFVTPSMATDITFSETYAFVADLDFGLQIFDISDIRVPKYVGSCDTPDKALGISILGTRIYIAGGSSGLLIIDVSNKTTPAIVGSYDTPGNATGVAVSNNMVYVADKNALLIIDVSKASDPTLVGSYSTKGSAIKVVSYENYALVVEGYDGMEIVDVSNAKYPTFAGKEDSYKVWDIALTTDTDKISSYGQSVVYTANGENGFKKFIWDHPCSSDWILFGSIFGLIISIPAGFFIYYGYKNSNCQKQLKSNKNVFELNKMPEENKVIDSSDNEDISKLGDPKISV